MSARVEMTDVGARVRPCDLPWNGRMWYDMPGTDEIAKRCNFFFWRRGKLDVEDEEKCERLAEDGITEIAEAQGRPARLVMRCQKRFGKIGRRAERDIYPSAKKQAEAEKTPRLNTKKLPPDEVKWRAQVRLALGRVQQSHYSGVSFVAAQAGIKKHTLRKWLREGAGLGKALVEKLEEILRQVEAGELKIETRRCPNPNGAQKAPPAGFVPFKQWLEKQSKARSVTVPSLRAWLKHHPEELPATLYKMNKRCFFVKQEEVAA